MVIGLHDGMEQRDIPVTVIGGYLGAGKTTVLNRILAGDHGQRLAVLVNDFGSINVDASLIAAHDGDTIALTNGCVCCSIADDLGTALKAQVTRTDPPDHILVEASGVADPAKIGRFSGGWPGCRLAQVIVLADLTTIRQRAADKFVGGLVQRQLQAADRIYLSKGDLLKPGQTTDTVRWVSSVAPDIPIHESTGGALDADGLVRVSLADRRGSSLCRATRDTDHESHNLRSFVWRPARPVQLQALSKILASHPEIHRAKGTIVSAALPSVNEARLLFNWSGGRADIDPAAASQSGAALVVIGTFRKEASSSLAAALDKAQDGSQTKHKTEAVG